MRKFSTTMAVLAVLAGGLLLGQVVRVQNAHADLDDYDPLADGSTFYDGPANATARTALSNSLVALMTAQVDTNTVADETLYTPRFIGDKLVGTVSNLFWMSEGVTTSSWHRLN